MKYVSNIWKCFKVFFNQIDKTFNKQIIFSEQVNSLNVNYDKQILWKIYSIEIKCV